jgi:hypothetical protein
VYFRGTGSLMRSRALANACASVSGPIKRPLRLDLTTRFWNPRLARNFLKWAAVEPVRLGVVTLLIKLLATALGEDLLFFKVLTAPRTRVVARKV